MKDTSDIPESLNKIVDIVLAYKPKPKTKAVKKRKRKKTALEKKANPPDTVGFLLRCICFRIECVAKVIAVWKQ